MDYLPLIAYLIFGIIIMRAFLNHSDVKLKEAIAEKDFSLYLFIILLVLFWPGLIFLAAFNSLR